MVIGLAKHTHIFLILSFTICIMIQCTDRPSLALSYGAFVQGDKTTFKLKAPKADRVFLVLFQNPEDKTGSEFLMKKQGTIGLSQPKKPVTVHSTATAWKVITWGMTLMSSLLTPIRWPL